MSNRTQQRDQILQDLDELEAQIRQGEIDPDTGENLRRRYRAELEALDATEEPADRVTRSRPRLVIGAGILLLSFAVTVAVLGSTVGEDTDGNLQGVAARPDFDPSSYSDETLEAVISASADDPAVAEQLTFMRFALAERYFERSEFQQAFTHYEAILADNPPAELFTATMTRIAWITFVGNSEVDLALQVIERALDATPGSTEALYVKGQILWCGANDAEAAAQLFAVVANSSELDPAIRSQVGADLAAASNGEPCQ